MAEFWEVSDDQTRYTFTIRDTAFFNGAPVTVHGVVYSLTAMQESPISDYAAAHAIVMSIEATEDRQVTVTLSRPSQACFQGMGGMAGLIQPGGARATSPPR